MSRDWIRSWRPTAGLAALLLWTMPVAASAERAWAPIQVLEQTIPVGGTKKFPFMAERTFEGSFLDAPVFVAHGSTPGPRLCVTSAIHGDEINSVEIARRVFASVDAKTLSGTLIVLPAVNSFGFRTGNRYMPDRRDLNRFFPGSADGSIAAIVAHAVFGGVVKDCSHLIDLHTGSNRRDNYPQIRVDGSDPAALALARSYAKGIVVLGAGPKGSLRREAMEAGIKAIIYEAGPPDVFQEEAIRQGVEGVRNVMAHLAMIEAKADPPRAPVLASSHWIRVPRGQGGIFLPVVALGDSVRAQQRLATITDPLSDGVYEIRADADGTVVGMALPQVVLSGYALFHLGTLEDR